MEPTPFVNKKAGQEPESAEPEETEKAETNKSLCLDELFEFSAARERALNRNAFKEAKEAFGTVTPHRVFLNHIDSYHGKHLADYLSEQIMGATRESLGEAEEEAKVEEEDEDLEGLTEEEIAELMKERQLEMEMKNEKHFYEIIGTLDVVHYPEYQRTEDIMEILDVEKKEDFMMKVQTCGFIIYDITTTLYCHPWQIDEASWVLEALVSQLEEMSKESPKAFKKYKDCRVFVLISTLLTWANTKPVDPDDPSAPFTEADWRKRKPHPNYKRHAEFEKRVIEVGKKFPKNLKTIVIGSAVSYGHEEDVLHFLFKLAWLNSPELPLFKPGRNKVPLIHIDSLVSILHLVLESHPRGYKYIIAVDQGEPTSLKKIVKLLSKKLGTGKYIKVEKEEAFLYPDIKQINYDMLTMNLTIEPGYIVDNMDVKWNSELPLPENINKIIKEYRLARNLLPIRIFMHGPPASGKSFMARRLAGYYRIHYLQVKEVIEFAIQKLKDRIQEMIDAALLAEEKEKEEKIEIEGEGEEEEEEAEEEEEEDVDTLKEELKEIEDNMAGSENNRLDDEFVIKFFKERMLSNPCQNQGFIMDGFPKTLEMTQTLYGPDDEGEEEAAEEEDESPQGGVEKLYNRKIMPAFVESLDASDDFLIKRVIALPEILVQNTHYMEEGMCRRLTDFRALNTDDNTPLIFYDELEVHPMIYNVELDVDLQMEPTFQAILKHVGSPRNYGAQGAELEEEIRLADELAAKQKLAELMRQEEEARIKAQERRDAMQTWMAMKDQEKEMEEKALALLAIPLRHYLMKYIFPTLTRGLVEVARIRPDDAVDFLAEFLFRENPEGKMFQPNYDDNATDLKLAVEQFQASIKSRVSETEPGVDMETFSSADSCRVSMVSNVTEVHALCDDPDKVWPPEPPPPKLPSSSSSEVCSCLDTPPPCNSSSSTGSSGYTPPPGSKCTCPPTSTHCRCPV